MMFFFGHPTVDKIRTYWDRQVDESFSYKEVGGTRHEGSPVGFNVDRHRVVLGCGTNVFDAACQSIRDWKMFPTAMSQLYWPHVKIEPDRNVIVGFRMGPFTSLNPCRIVYTVDENLTNASGRTRRYGFAYGTLPGHVEKGEERFLVSWNEKTDVVEYEILCFSAAQHFLAVIGHPFVRLQQSRFRKLSGRAMQESVRSSETENAR